jgi:hypothetical protein
MYLLLANDKGLETTQVIGHLNTTGQVDDMMRVG